MIIIPVLRLRRKKQITLTIKVLMKITRIVAMKTLKLSSRAVKETNMKAFITAALILSVVRMNRKKNLSTLMLVVRRETQRSRTII